MRGHIHPLFSQQAWLFCTEKLSKVHAKHNLSLNTLKSLGWTGLTGGRGAKIESEIGVGGYFRQAFS